MASTLTETLKTPGEPKPVEELTFVLYYRQGNNPYAMQKWFKHKGDLQSAIMRGRKHCEIINARFVRVTSFMSDLDVEEKSYGAS